MWSFFTGVGFYLSIYVTTGMSTSWVLQTQHPLSHQVLLCQFWVLSGESWWCKVQCVHHESYMAGVCWVGTQIAYCDEYLILRNVQQTPWLFKMEWCKIAMQCRMLSSIVRAPTVFFDRTPVVLMHAFEAELQKTGVGFLLVSCGKLCPFVSGSHIDPILQRLGPVGYCVGRWYGAHSVSFKMEIRLA